MSASPPIQKRSGDFSFFRHVKQEEGGTPYAPMPAREDQISQYKNLSDLRKISARGRSKISTEYESMPAEEKETHDENTITMGY